MMQGYKPMDYEEQLKRLHEYGGTISSKKMTVSPSINH